MSDPLSTLLHLPFAFDDTHYRFTRDTFQILSNILENLIYNYTVPLSFETYPEDIHTLPLIREHHDSLI